MNESQAFTVTDVVQHMAMRLTTDPFFSGMLVEGEISNFKPWRSGHWYFDLKDEQSRINCVMWSGDNRKLNFVPKDGDKVIVRARLDVYAGRGSVQLRVSDMKPSGIGDLYLQFEKLKKKLSEEGLFNPEHKKAIPPYPMRIALVTGNNTAAHADVMTTLDRRWPIAMITDYPVLVQGENSAPQIIRALRKADEEGYDVILLVRGGGSIEDLWSFNDEALARTIYQLKTPIITGIGHEIDFTIADFVADLRAPTPTGAAERCAPDMKDVLASLEAEKDSMMQNMHARLEKEEQLLHHLSQSAVFTIPDRLYSEKEFRLENIRERFLRQLNSKSSDLKAEIAERKNVLLNEATHSIQGEKSHLSQSHAELLHAVQISSRDKRAEFDKKIRLLDAYSPLKILGRGYSITEKNHHPIVSSSQLQKGDSISIRFHEGTADAIIDKISEEK